MALLTASRVLPQEYLFHIFYNPLDAPVDIKRLYSATKCVRL